MSQGEQWSERASDIKGDTGIGFCRINRSLRVEETVSVKHGVKVLLENSKGKVESGELFIKLEILARPDTGALRATLGSLDTH